MRRTCVSCGIVSQRYGKSWKFWNQCANCAKRSNPDYYAVKKCVTCGATSNNTNALCWKTSGQCGKCYHQNDDLRKQRKVVCPECRVQVCNLRYNKLGSKKIKLYYCTNCTGIISERGARLFQLQGLIV